jgi:hypothetical protein
LRVIEPGPGKNQINTILHLNLQHHFAPEPAANIKSPINYQVSKQSLLICFKDIFHICPWYFEGASASGILKGLVKLVLAEFMTLPLQGINACLQIRISTCCSQK